MMSTVVFMPITWPQASFIEYIEALRIREGFKDTAEMMRAAKLDPSLHTNWRKGKRPTMASLDKLAPVLGVSPTALYLKAGHLKPDDLKGDVDLSVLPREILDLIALYESMTTDAARQYIRQHIDFALRGLRASAPEPEQIQPRPRRRAS